MYNNFQCVCKPIDFSIFPVVSFGDYSGYSTSTFMCPDHHPFFTFAAGVAHIHPDSISSSIYHTWCDGTTNHLHMLVQTGFDYIMEVCAFKAWRLLNNNDAVVSIHRYECGRIYVSNIFQEEEEIQQCNRLLIKSLL